MSSNSQEFKVVFLGDAAVGKTSLILRYINNQFNHDSKSTITASFFTKTAFIHNTQIRLQIWDTAGQERFQSVAPMYYRNADVIFVVCSNDMAQSVQKAHYWLEKVKENSIKQNVIISLLTNKIDLPCQFSEQQVKQVCEEFNVRSFGVSAKTGEGVFNAIQQTIDQLHLNNEVDNNKYIDVNNSGQQGGKGGCC